MQAAVSSFGSARRAMLDREVMLHFRDTATKARIMGSVTADLLQSLAGAPVPGARPKSFGGRCDLLALDSDGRLLAVEVKPRGVPTIAWAPAQAIVYARLLRLWTRSDPQAGQIISGMISQRQELGLLDRRAAAPSPCLRSSPSWRCSAACPPSTASTSLPSATTCCSTASKKLPGSTK